MIFLIIQTIKENTNHNVFTELMVSSSVLGYLFFRKIKPFKDWNNVKKSKLFFILGLFLIILALVIRFAFSPPLWDLMKIISVLGFIMWYFAILCIHGRKRVIKTSP
jgi:magnesium-transporting ATPase (P-type)